MQLGFVLWCGADSHLEPHKLQQCKRPQCMSQPLSHWKRAEGRSAAHFCVMHSCIWSVLQYDVVETKYMVQRSCFWDVMGSSAPPDVPSVFALKPALEACS